MNQLELNSIDGAFQSDFQAIAIIKTDEITDDNRDDIESAIESIVETISSSYLEYAEENTDYADGYDCLVSEACHGDIFNRVKEEIADTCKLSIEAVEVLEDSIDLRESAYEWKCESMYSSGTILELESFGIGEIENQVELSTIQSMLEDSEDGYLISTEDIKSILTSCSEAYSVDSDCFLTYCNSDNRWSAILPVEACKELITEGIIDYLSK